jgi:hypothetical protein
MRVDPKTRQATTEHQRFRLGPDGHLAIHRTGR